MRALEQYNQLKQQQNQQQQENMMPSGGYWSNDGPRNFDDIRISSGFAGGGFYIPRSQPQQQPQIDTSDPINSLAQMLVPPAEREAREQKMLKNKRRMIAWTALFDGLRQLGNLYYATKGATPQQFTDKPYQQIEQDYQDEVKRQDALMAHRDKYAAQLWNLQRQANEDARKKALSDAQAKWYGSREEQNKRKMEIEEFKAQTDADYKKATLEQKNALNEVKIRLLEGEINKKEAERQYKLILMGNAQSGTITTTTKPDGTVTTVEKKPARRSGGNGNRKQRRKSATQL